MDENVFPDVETTDPNKFVFISLQVSEQERRDYDVLAATFGLSRSEMVRQAIRFYSQILMARLNQKANPNPADQIRRMQRGR